MSNGISFHCVATEIASDVITSRDVTHVLSQAAATCAWPHQNAQEETNRITVTQQQLDYRSMEIQSDLISRCHGSGVAWTRCEERTRDVTATRRGAI